MLDKEMLIRLFDASSIQRWNDHIHPMEFPELDKQSHKMIVAFIISKFEEENSKTGFDWTRIFEGEIFEMLQRIVITYLKSLLFHRIRRDTDRYNRLNDWIYDQIKGCIKPIGQGFAKRFNFHDANVIVAFCKHDHKLEFLLRHTASILAPLIDKNWISIRGMVGRYSAIQMNAMFRLP